MSAVGALAALALHLLFVSALTFGTSAAKSPTREGDLAGLAMASASEAPTSMLVFIDPTTLSGQGGMSAPSQRIRPPVLKALEVARLVRLSSIERALTGENEDLEKESAAALAEADGAERAVLYGRYANQIVARIEAAWVRPQSAPDGRGLWEHPAGGASPSRTLPGAAPFRCRVQILQGQDGSVREVTLLDCDSSPEWQQSLVNAIDAASPLPAPPSQSVFARTLVLSFTSATAAAPVERTASTAQGMP